MTTTDAMRDRTIPAVEHAGWCDEHSDGGPLDQECRRTWALTAKADIVGDPVRYRLALSQRRDRPDHRPQWRVHEPTIVLEAEHLFDDGDTGLAGGDLTLSEARDIAVQLTRLIDHADIDGLLR